MFLSYTAELATYPPGHSFVEAASAGIRRVDAVPAMMADFGARQDIPLEVCRREILSSDVHLSLIGFRYGSVIPERTDGISYIEFEFQVAAAAGIPRLAFLVDDRTPIPPALVDHDRTLISRFRHRVQEGADHLATAFVTDPGRLEAAVSQALVRIGTTDRPPAAEAPPADGPDLDLDTLVRLLASHFRVDVEAVDRQHAAVILRALEGTPYTAAAEIEGVLARTANRRQRYFGRQPGSPGASEQLAVALAILEPACRTAGWGWGWDRRSREQLEALARETD